jgi:prepilin-type N-terminal cleavage/methylation domain-containing protein
MHVSPRRNEGRWNRHIPPSDQPNTRDLRQGFTLIEIMIVVLLIGLLSMIAIPGFIRARENARSSLCMTHQRLLEAAVDRWAFETGAPTGTSALRADLQPYLRRGEWPMCPFGNTPFPNEIPVDTPVQCPSGVAAHVR